VHRKVEKYKSIGFSSWVSLQRLFAWQTSQITFNHNIKSIMFVQLRPTKFKPEPTLVNADCQNIILLDYCKNVILLSTIEELQRRKKEGNSMIQICENKVKLVTDAAAAEEGDEENVTPEKEELGQWSTYVNKISSSLNTLEDSKMTVELHDESDTLVKLSDMPKQSAKESLTIRAIYSLMCYIEGNDPISHVDMCNIESPLEVQQQKDQEAAKALAAEKEAAKAAAEQE
jgi:hypothetical protein